MYINREQRLKEVCKTQLIHHKKDIALQYIQMIDENGEIHQTTKHVEVNESEMISSIPAYTTKIEYMQKYGTLTGTGEIKLKTAPAGMSEIDVMKLRDSIIENGIVQNLEKKKQDVVEPKKKENIVEPIKE